MPTYKKTCREWPSQQLVVRNHSFPPRVVANCNERFFFLTLRRLFGTFEFIEREKKKNTKYKIGYRVGDKTILTTNNL